MADFDHIEEWYKNKMDGLSLDPQEEVWDKVETTLETDLVWAKLEDSLDMDAVWNRLDDSLDIDEVWNRIENTLEDKDRRIGWYWWSSGVAAAILTLFVLGFALRSNSPAEPGMLYADNGKPTVTEMRPFIGTGSTNTPANQNGNAPTDLLKENTDPQKSGTDTYYASEDGNPSQNDKSLKKGKSGKELIKEKYNNQVIQFASRVDMKNRSNDTIQEGDPRYTPDQLELKKTIVGYLETHKVALAKLNLPPGFRMPDPTAAIPMNEDTEKEKLPRQFFVGGSMGVKNQWLMAHDTYASFKKTEEQSAQLDFAGTMGVNAGMQLTQKLGIQTDYILKSTAGQKYTDYNDGRSVDRELDFNYQSLLLSARLKRKEGTLLKKPIADHFNLGMYGGLLTQAQEQISGKTTSNISSDYKTYDMGLSVGYGVDFRPTPGVIAGFGLRLQQGLVNTYEGTQLLPSSLNRTYNTSIDFIFNLRYALGKK